jgi:PTS system ascorbate-specific IIA component
MIGVLVLTHGATGEHMLATARQILGSTALHAAALGVEPDADPQTVIERARALAQQLDDGSGVLILTDMYGATPGNVAAALLADGRVEGVAGLSLPMLVRVLSGRERRPRRRGEAGALRRRRGRAAHERGLLPRCQALKYKSSTSWDCTRAPPRS